MQANIVARQLQMISWVVRYRAALTQSGSSRPKMINGAAGSKSIGGVSVGALDTKLTAATRKAIISIGEG